MTPQFDHLPEKLQTTVASLWSDYLAAANWDVEQQLSPDLAQSLPVVWAASEFTARTCMRIPELLQCWSADGDLKRSLSREDIRASIAAVVADAADEAACMTALRRARNRQMARIAWRDIAGWADVEETLREVSDLADACISAALDYAEQLCQAEAGVPHSGDGEPQRMVVIGMGKLGGLELNFSSDIDLILTYPEVGETRDGPRTLANEQFFTLVARRLIKLLDEKTADGFVYRVDTRLRPYGGSGPLVLSFDAMEEYYQSQGREWERYAWIKARIVAGDEAQGDLLLETLRPFIYRRYLDFGAFESLREMKTMIRRELERKGMGSNVKLGRGGIREVEFIGQAFQLMRGGRLAELRERGILKVLQLLAEHDYLPRYVANELREAYLFLRKVENRIQQFRDEQTHIVPEGNTARARLALGMGFTGWDEFSAPFDQHRNAVHEFFEQVFAAPQSEQVEGSDDGPTLIWHGLLDHEAAHGTLLQQGFKHAKEALDRLKQLKGSRLCRAMSSQGRDRLDRLMPLLLGAASGSADPDESLARLLPLVERIAQRSSYIALLVENPMALSQLVRLTSASPWIAQQMAKFPLLLDEFLDPRTLYVPPDREGLAKEMAVRLANIDAQDLEQRMDSLRHFKLANVMRVAAADVSEAVPLMQVSDHLTWIAERVLASSLDAAREHLVARHGRPLCGVGENVHEAGFIIVAYGKMGGLELGYGSDLDLVFIRESGGDAPYTDGDKPVDNNVFFARLAQRLIHILTAHTAAGPLYEVDMRLRPSGNSGMLVADLKGFERYQREEAWTWEHQALVRARVVAGDARLAEAFTRLRIELLSQPRDAALLRDEVVGMRDKMRGQLDRSTTEQFDIKQGVGGITDIEFMVQYSVLRWSYQHPGLLEFSDNIRQLEGLAKAGLYSPEMARFLADAYRGYRRVVHRMALQQQPSLVSVGQFEQERAGVKRYWQELMEA